MVYRVRQVTKWGEGLPLQQDGLPENGCPLWVNLVPHILASRNDARRRERDEMMAEELRMGEMRESRQRTQKAK